MLIIGGLVAVFVAWAMLLGMVHPRSGRKIIGGSLRSDEAEAEIEAHDIDQMIEARDERRRRAGLPGIGDELERELRRDRQRPGDNG